MIDTTKQIKVVVTTPVENKLITGLRGTNPYWHHHGHMGNDSLYIVLCICITLIFIFIIGGWVLLKWQSAKINAEKAERDDNFENQKLMDDRYAQAALDRENRLKDDEEKRKIREFVITLIEKLKLKHETTTQAAKDGTTEKKELKETINNEFLKTLIEKITDIPF